MKSMEATGYNKEKALESTGLDVELERLKNATLAWKKAGSPLATKALNAFMANYIKDKKAVGAYIVVESSSDDTRKRPYSVINEVTTGRRKAKTSYLIKEGEFKVKYNKVINEEGVESEVPSVSVISLGAVEAKAPKKDEALKLAKELTTANRKNYVVEIVREITEGQKYAAYVEYTPSASATLGKFMFFVAE